MQYYWCSAVILIEFISVINGRRICDGGKVLPFKPINPSNYDRNYSNIQSHGKRPLGYEKGVWYYDNPYDGQLCVEVKNTTRKQIEIMIQTWPPSRICVRDKINDICNDETLHSCLPAPDNSPATLFEFYCDAECSQTDVNFWYRFTVSDPTNPDWCSERNTDEFPESLFTLPFIPPPKPKHAPRFNQSPATCSWTFLITLSVITTLCFTSTR